MWEPRWTQPALGRMWPSGWFPRRLCWVVAGGWVMVCWWWPGSESSRQCFRVTRAESGSTSAQETCIWAPSEWRTLVSMSSRATALHCMPTPVWLCLVNAIWWVNIILILYHKPQKSHLSSLFVYCMLWAVFLLIFVYFACIFHLYLNIHPYLYSVWYLFMDAVFV